MADSDTPSLPVHGADHLPSPGSGVPAPGAAPADPVAGQSDPADLDFFRRLQRRLFQATLAATALALPASWLLFDSSTACSLLVGALSGLLYLRLLARSVSRLGGTRRSLGRFQLLVPVVLVLACSRIPQLELLPALVGFLLYKPALLLQALPDR